MTEPYKDIYPEAFWSELEQRLAEAFIKPIVNEDWRKIYFSDEESNITKET